MQPIDLAYIFTCALGGAIILHVFGVVGMMAWVCLISGIYVLHP
jgi:hypothetical protein